MFEPINEVAVLVSAILALAVGSVWYSPLMFGDEWMRSVGFTDDDLEESKDKLPKMFAFAIIANLITLYIIAQFIAFSEETMRLMRDVGLLLVILLGSIMANAVIWEKRSISYFLINLGYATVVIFIGIAVIGYWPW